MRYWFVIFFAVFLECSPKATPPEQQAAASCPACPVCAAPSMGQLEKIIAKDSILSEHLWEDFGSPYLPKDFTDRAAELKRWHTTTLADLVGTDVDSKKLKDFFEGEDTILEAYPSALDGLKDKDLAVSSEALFTINQRILADVRDTIDENKWKHSLRENLGKVDSTLEDGKNKAKALQK